MWWYFKKVKWFVLFWEKKMRKAVQSWDPRWLPNPIWPPKWLTIPTPGFLSRTPKNPCRPVTEIQSKKSPFWRRKICSGRVCFFIQCLLSNSWPKGQCISDSVFLELLPFLKSWRFKTVLWPIYSGLQHLEAEIWTVLQVSNAQFT